MVSIAPYTRKAVYKELSNASLIVYSGTRPANADAELHADNITIARARTGDFRAESNHSWWEWAIWNVTGTVCRAGVPSFARICSDDVCMAQLSAGLMGRSYERIQDPEAELLFMAPFAEEDVGSPVAIDMRLRFAWA